ncbi:MAG: 4Fe-4S ferredoxin [Candidatus Adiutrix sp.]|jgi:NAD-dependent dihydropyrimidine dehydrogenase PreA subunit|nr:4Fe-4S ferredoxin [Candidatus Adiutrix sp.]
MPLTALGNQVLRDIIEIDEGKCDGCGQCLGGCAEGALALVEGKARLVSDNYCDGLGACLGRCPTGALKIIKRPAPTFAGPAPTAGPPRPEGRTGPGLVSWPIQLRLVQPGAAAFDNPVLILAADCTAFAGPSFQATFLTEGRPLVIACPKLDDLELQIDAATALLKAHPKIEEIRLPLMSIPCCGGLGRLVGEAARRAGRPDIRQRIWLVTPDGEITETLIR